VLPVSRSVPVDAFARKLQAALEGIRASTSFFQSSFWFRGILVVTASRGWASLRQRPVSRQEKRYRVLYVADSPVVVRDATMHSTGKILRIATCVNIFIPFGRQIASWSWEGDDLAAVNYGHGSCHITHRRIVAHPHDHDANLLREGYNILTHVAFAESYLANACLRHGLLTGESATYKTVRYRCSWSATAPP